MKGQRYMEMDFEERCYCAFLDILGFSAILHDWDKAKAIYGDFSRYMADVLKKIEKYSNAAWAVPPDGYHLDLLSLPAIRFSIISDSIILTCRTFWILKYALIKIQKRALCAGIYLRGAVSYGIHYEQVSPPHHFILSQALASAAAAEKAYAVVPRIIMDPKMTYKWRDDFPTNLRGYDGCMVQCPDNLWVVNPLYSATSEELQTITSLIDHDLSRTEDEHIGNKYKWLLGLLHDWRKASLSESITLNYNSETTPSAVETDGWEPLIFLKEKLATVGDEERVSFPQIGRSYTENRKDMSLFST